MGVWRRVERRLSWSPWYRRGARDADLERELRDHLELEAEEQQATGLSHGQAALAAHLALGNTLKIEEDVRAAWGLQWLETFAQDIRYALRMLRKSPGFTAAAVLTLALGIGANTSIFSVVDATLLRPLPYPQPEQLVRIVDNLPGIGARDVGMSVPEWHDLERSGIFQYVSPMGGGASANLTGSSQPTRAQLNAVPPNYFALLGVKPLLGRTFNPDDRTPGFNLEVVISEGLWKRAFGADPDILGKSLRLDNDLYHIVGVMPAAFHDPGRTSAEQNTEVWAALGFSAPPTPPPVRNSHWIVEAIGRIKPGLTIAQAQSQVDALTASLQKRFADDYPAKDAWAVQLVPLKQSLIGNARPSLMLLLGAVGLTLLIACVNIANLLLARASARRRELAVRQALGGMRGRLIQQLITESVLLFLLGGSAGIALLFSAKGLLLQLVPESIPRFNAISMNWAVLLFALVASLAAGAICGVIPALQASRFDVNHMLKQEGRGSTVSGQQARTRRVLVVTEFALSLVLMIAAGLLLRSFSSLLSVQLGFNAQNVMAVQTWLPVPNDPATDIYRTPAQEAPFIREVLRRVQELPGVQEGAIGDLASLPLGHSQNNLNSFPLIVEGHEVPASQAPIMHVSIVTPGYFRLLRMPLLRGRLFTEFDSEKAPAVAIVNDAFARAYFSNEDPIGKRLKFAAFGGSYWAAIVGVLADARTESPAASAAPQLYLSLYQRRAKDLAIFLRGRLDATVIPKEVREQVQSVDPALPVFGAQTLDETVSESLAERRFSMEMIVLFALAALLLAAVGIYGVISYVVAERTHEIGIRMALGAQRAEVMRLVLGEGLKLAGLGVATGLLASFAVARLMSTSLYGVSSTDPLTFVFVAAVLTAVALAACYIPARRAMKVDPMVALRYE